MSFLRPADYLVGPKAILHIELPDFTQLNILVIGDVMIDRYLAGKVDRISPEAPVPVMLLGKEENRLGGAANVAFNLKALGATPLLAGVTGDDLNGTLLRELLADQALTTDLMVKDPDRPTTVKTRLTASGQQLMRVDREATHQLKDSVAESLLSAIRDTVRKTDIDLVLLQDYNKGVLHPALTAAILDLANEHGIPSAVDPKKENFWTFRQCTLFKPNLREIQSQVDFLIVPTVESLDQAAEVIFERLDCQATMITLSEHGIYVNDGSSGAIFATNARGVADVSGAGDTVISVAACGLAAGMSLPDIAKLANLAGAQVIAKRGVVAVDLPALLQALHN